MWPSNLEPNLREKKRHPQMTQRVAGETMSTRASFVEVQPLLESDLQAIRLHLLSLNADDRYARFGLVLDDEALFKWMRSIDWAQQSWWGAWLNPDMGLAGVAQLIPTHAPGAWELALSVSAPARRLGIGTRLLTSAVGRMPEVRRIICVHGHMAVKAMVKRLELHLECRACGAGLELSRG